MLKKTVSTISVEKLQNSNQAYVLLDAREEKEYNVSHLKSALYVGYKEFDVNQISTVNKDTPIIVYCSIGVRSEKIGEKLIAAGFSNVKNLYGGIFEWVNQNNTLVDSSGKQTQKVHAYDKKWGIWLKKGEKVYR